MKLRFRCVFGAVLVLALGFSAARATQYTNPVQLGVLAANNWTDLGAGPLTVSTTSTFGVKVALSDTQPAAGFGGELLIGLRHFESTSHVWALAYQGTAAFVTVTNESSGVAGGSGTTLPSFVGAPAKIAIATTGTPVCLPSLALSNGIVIKAAPFNAAHTSSYTGAAGDSGVTTTWTGKGFPLDPDEAVSFNVSNASAVCVDGTAGDVFSYAGN